MAKKPTKSTGKRSRSKPKSKGNASRPSVTETLIAELKGYHDHSRTLALGFLLVIPLLLVYELGIALLKSPVSSGAGMQVKAIFHLAFGARSVLAFNAAVVAVFVAAFIYLKRKGIVRTDLLPVLILESTAYALVLGYGVSALTSQIPLSGYTGVEADSAALRVILSIGAGVYEEIIFRLILMSSLYAIATLLFPSSISIATPILVLLSAVVFSACHHLGMGCEPFCSYKFFYRFFFGIAMSAIYIYRGLGAAVYTHAIYDVFVSLQYGL